MSRDYAVHVPANLSANPGVVILLHGSGGTGCGMEDFTTRDTNGTNFDTLADQNNFITMYPTLTSNTNGLSVPHTQLAPDEVFVSKLIDKAISQYNVDPTKVYVTGSSAGAMLTFAVACDLSNKVSGAVAVSGSFYEAVYDFCNPQRSVPFLDIHGTLDKNVDYALCVGTTFCHGTPQYNYTDPQTAITQMAQVMGCSSSATNGTMSTPIRHIGLWTKTYGACGGVATSPVKIDVLNNGHHSWLGVLSLTSGTQCCAADINQMAWNFMARHTPSG